MKTEDPTALQPCTSWGVTIGSGFAKLVTLVSCVSQQAGEQVGALCQSTTPHPGLFHMW